MIGVGTSILGNLSKYNSTTGKAIVDSGISAAALTLSLGTFVSPMSYGCVGDGNADDTTCMQSAITAAMNAGVPLLFDARHLYNITSTLNITLPIKMVGPYRYGIWAVNQPTASGPQSCPWGLLMKNTGLDMLRASAVTGTISGVCFDMTGDGTGSTNPTAGAAIDINPPNASTYSAGWKVTGNTILYPFDGITAPGNGAVTQCCGIGALSDGAEISHNTIISPKDAAIAIGKNSTASTGGPNIAGLIIDDNNIACKNSASKTGAYGVVIYSGSVSYNGTQNGPEGCYIGTAVIPGTVGGNAQYAQFDGDGVFGDQSGLYNLLVQPTAGGVLEPLLIGGKEPWANYSSSGHPSVLIDCTSAATCEEFRISGLTANIGAANSIGLDLEGGANGPYDVTIEHSSFCQQSSVNTGTIGLKLNAGSGSTGAWIVTGNRIGNACFGGVGNAPIGISLTVSPSSTFKGALTIVGNDIDLAATPLSYTPGAGDQVIIANNMGVDNIIPTVTSGSSVTFPLNPIIQISGTAAMNTVAGAYGTVQHTTIASGNWSTTAKSGGAQNICNALSATSGLTYIWTWDNAAACWHVK